MKWFYVPLERALRLLIERRKLIPEVEAWWYKQGWDVPPIMHAGRAGFFTRQLASFRYEDAAFQLQCQRAGLMPVWMPYELDRFSLKSSLKKSYVSPLFCSGHGRDGGLRTFRRRLVDDPRHLEGERLNEIMTGDGVSLVDFHRNLHRRYSGGGAVQEMSSVLRQIGGPRDYYRFDMSLLIAHGVLFEDFHGGESGQKLNSFTSRIFEPAFYEIMDLFGVPPLIVRMPWHKTLGYYPANPDWLAHGVLNYVLLR